MGRKLRRSWSPIQHFILTIPACHDRTKERSSVGKFPISLTDFTQRRQISRKDRLLQGTNQEKGNTNKSEYSFSKHINPKTKALRPYEFVGRRITLLRFSHKEQTSDKVYRFSDK